MNNVAIGKVFILGFFILSYHGLFETNGALTDFGYYLSERNLLRSNDERLFDEAHSKYDTPINYNNLLYCK